MYMIVNITQDLNIYMLVNTTQELNMYMLVNTTQELNIYIYACKLFVYHTFGNSENVFCIQFVCVYSCILLQQL